MQQYIGSRQQDMCSPPPLLQPAEVTQRRTRLIPAVKSDEWPSGPKVQGDDQGESKGKKKQ